MLFPKKSTQIKPGDRVVVGSWNYIRTTVERLEVDPDTGSLAIHLDWGDFGKSRVWGHDEGKTWRRYDNVN